MPGLCAMSLDGKPACALIPLYQPAGRPLPGLRATVAHQANPVEESPGSMETRWRLTAAGGDPRESATESKPPRLAGVRVKGCGKSAPRRRRRRRQGKPHREQDQIGVAGCARKRGARSVFRPATRVDCSRRPAMDVPDEWPSRRGNPPDRTRLTGRLVISRLCSVASRPKSTRFRTARERALTIKMCCGKSRPEAQDRGKD